MKEVFIVRENFELSKEEVCKICKKQSLSSYIFAFIWALVAIVIIVFAIINAVNNEDARVPSIIMAMLILFAGCTLVKAMIERASINNKIKDVYSKDINTLEKIITPIKHDFNKFVPNGITSDNNLYYSFITLTVIENEKRVNYYYVSLKPLKVTVDDLLDNKEIKVILFEGTNIIKTIGDIEKE